MRGSPLRVCVDYSDDLCCCVTQGPFRAVIRQRQSGRPQDQQQPIVGPRHVPLRDHLLGHQRARMPHQSIRQLDRPRYVTFEFN